LTLETECQEAEEIKPQVSRRICGDNHKAGRAEFMPLGKLLAGGVRVRASRHPGGSKMPMKTGLALIVLIAFAVSPSCNSGTQRFSSI
jgi:hypothetical protein